MNAPVDPCSACRLVGWYVPWALIIAGGIIGMLPVSAAWAENSAYLVAFSLLVLACGYIFKRLSPTE